MNPTFDYRGRIYPDLADAVSSAPFQNAERDRYNEWIEQMAEEAELIKQAEELERQAKEAWCHHNTVTLSPFGEGVFHGSQAHH